MTIRVSTPGGATIEFPEGTDTATIQRVMQQASGTVVSPARMPSDYAPLPVPGQSVAPNPGRFGDFLRPVFGGHNPIAEVADVALPALDPRSKRDLPTRALDTMNFAASLPLQAVGLPSVGQIGEWLIGPNSVAQSERRFAENNPDLLYGLGWAGAAAGGTSPMGQGSTRPAMPRQPTQASIAAAEDAARARGMVSDMENIGVRPFAPAVASARRTDNSPGALTQALADKPFVGTPLQRGARQFVGDMTDAQGRITEEYGSSRTMQGAGANLRTGLEEFREGRGVDVKAMPDPELTALARQPARMGTMSDVAAAKYELAERYLPDDKAKAEPVGKGEERVMGALGNTTQILRDIKRRYGLTINKSEAARARKGQGNDLSLDNAPDFSNPRWTGSPNIDRSLDAIAGAKGNWRTGIEGMREIRSMIRRALSTKPDSEVNALSRADLQRLYSAVSRDMDTLLTRLENQTAAVNPQLSQRYAQARQAYKDADTFYARHSGAYDQVRSLLNLRSDESAAGAVLTAMRDGTRGNRELLVSLRRTLPREVIDEVASSVITELGRPTGRASGAIQEGGFSPSRFASQWNSLSDDARRLMFGHRPELKRELDAFARVAQGMADYEALANNSRTGVSNAVWGVVAGGTAGLAHLPQATLAGVIGTALTGRAAAQFLVSPRYVRWLTRADEIVRSGNPQASARHLLSLERMIRNDGALDDMARRSILTAIGVGAGRTPSGQPGSEPAQTSRPAPRG
jgi:hypothetical protein